MQSFTWKKAKRITHGSEILATFKSGKRVDEKRMRMVICEGNKPFARFGVIIGKGIKGSVKRNRFKRLMREVLRQRAHEIKRNNLIFYLKEPIIPATFANTEREIVTLLKHGKLLISSSEFSQ
jgi:ribonuclease P protein component